MAQKSTPTTLNKQPPPQPVEREATKKEQILALFSNGIDAIEEISQMTGCKPSYVANVLQESGHLKGYFDLYTHTSNPMNVYSQIFGGRLGFKDEEAARRSVEIVETAYRGFELQRDRAGQHHALVSALTMYDRARWSGKTKEAEIFRQWLAAKLQQGDLH